MVCVETVINPLEMVQADSGGDAAKPEHEMRWLLTTRWVLPSKLIILIESPSMVCNLIILRKTE